MTYASFSATPSTGYWKDGVWWYGTMGATTTVVPTYAWSAPQPAAPLGWKCADCGLVMAPWVAAHDCVTAPSDVSNTGPEFLAKCSDCPPDGQCANCGETQSPAA